MTVQAVTTFGAREMLDQRELAELHNGMRGELITPEDPNYDEARQLFNAMIDKRPAVIARSLRQ